MTTILTIFSNHGFEVLADLVKKRTRNQGCAPSFLSDHLSMSRSGFVAGGHTPYLKDYVEERNFILDRPGSRNHVERIFSYEKFGPSRRMRNSFGLTAGDGRTDLYYARQACCCCLV